MLNLELQGRKSWKHKRLRAFDYTGSGSLEDTSYHTKTPPTKEATSYSTGTAPCVVRRYVLLYKNTSYSTKTPPSTAGQYVTRIGEACSSAQLIVRIEPPVLLS